MQKRDASPNACAPLFVLFRIRLLVVVVTLGVLEGGTTKENATHQMHMEMAYGGCGVRTRVHDGAIAAVMNTLNLGNLREGAQHMPDDFLGNLVVEVLVVLLRDKEGVDRGLGLEVVKRHANIILVDDLCRDFASNDLAENAIVVHKSHLSSRLLYLVRKTYRIMLSNTDGKQVKIPLPFRLLQLLFGLVFVWPTRQSVRLSRVVLGAIEVPAVWLDVDVGTPVAIRRIAITLGGLGVRQNRIVLRIVAPVLHLGNHHGGDLFHAQGVGVDSFYRAVVDVEGANVGDVRSCLVGGLANSSVVVVKLDAADTVGEIRPRGAGNRSWGKVDTPRLGFWCDVLDLLESLEVCGLETRKGILIGNAGNLVRFTKVLRLCGSGDAAAHNLVSTAAPTVIVDTHKDQDDVRLGAVVVEEAVDALVAVSARKTEPFHDGARVGGIADKVAAKMLDDLAPPRVTLGGDTIDVDLAFVVGAPIGGIRSAERAD